MRQSLEVLAIQAEQIRSQVLALRGQLFDHRRTEYESSLLVAAEVLFGQIVAGLRLASDPVLRSSTAERLARDADDRRKRATVATDPRA